MCLVFFLSFSFFRLKWCLQARFQLGNPLLLLLLLLVLLFETSPVFGQLFFSSSLPLLCAPCLTVARAQQTNPQLHENVWQHQRLGLCISFIGGAGRAQPQQADAQQETKRQGWRMKQRTFDDKWSCEVERARREPVKQISRCGDRLRSKRRNKAREKKNSACSCSSFTWWCSASIKRRFS